MNETSEHEMTFEERVEAERVRRRGFHGGWHYWSASGRDEPTLPEHWCSYCAGWFGVPHVHRIYSREGVPCRNRFRDHACACIDCWVFQNRADVVLVAVSSDPEAPKEPAK